jgi:RNA polymerase sigma-70 factor (ECF subfamily)
VDSATIRAAQRGDLAAQRSVLESVGPLLASLVRRLGDRREAADQLQALFAHLLSVLPRFEPDGPASFSTWTYTVAHRWLLKARQGRQLTLFPLDGGLSSPQLDPEAAAQGAQLSARLEAALTELPAEQRRVFVLAQLHGHALEAVAAAEQVPLGTVKSRLHRARAALVLRLGAFLDERGGAHGAAGRR